MLGVVIGSACIVLVVTIALIGKTYVLAQIEGVGSNIVYADYGGGTANARSEADEISLNDLEAVAICRMWSRWRAPPILPPASSSMDRRRPCAGGCDPGLSEDPQSADSGRALLR